MLTVTEQQGNLLISGIGPLDLEQTLDCGQCFRFAPDGDGGWQGMAGDRFGRFRMEGDILVARGMSGEDFETFWRSYLDLDRDYEKLYRSVVRRVGGRMGACVRFAPGVRLLRQDAWETLISFIISQNNNVSRIKGIIDRLCRGFGRPVGTPEGERYAFPEPDVLAGLTEEDLAPLRSGWRSGYILDAARRVVSGETDLEAISVMPLEDARKELQKIRGVGPKVAECVLLFGMGRLEAFPMDVWMKRAMKVLFPGKKPEDFGPYAGIAQQVVFHYCRRHSQEIRDQERAC